MDKLILSALKAIDVADLTRADWIAVGMALKEEGFPVSVWDDWSKNDSRYKPGECERLWNGFHGSSNPVRGGTIVKLAQERGWSPFKGEGGCLNWDDSISYDGREDSIQSIGAKENWNPAQDLIRYLDITPVAAEYGIPGMGGWTYCIDFYDANDRFITGYRFDSHYIDVGRCALAATLPYFLPLLF